VLDGERVSDKEIIATISGTTRSILMGERLALNFLQRLSGISTLTRKFVEAIVGNGRDRSLQQRLKPFQPAKILDTRKTTPLWRRLEKYAVVIGGGVNHRLGLYDQILIKDNHIKAAGSVTKALEITMKKNKSKLPVIIEIQNKKELLEIFGERCASKIIKERYVSSAPKFSVDVVMLDNMSVKEIKECVDIINSRCQIEISGNVNLNNIEKYRDLKIHRISIGALTHSVKAIDISLELI
jgi:nicotinate-nucleotide pyrophosphorylase (carboxylating)